MTAEPTRRRYDASRRQEGARQTRLRILTAAEGLFTTLGYAATTITEIADAAEVAPQTVYAAFGTKRAILKELVDIRIAGNDEPIPVIQQPFVQRILSTPDGPDKFRIFAEHLRAVHERTVDVLAALRAAADSDPDIAELWRNLLDQRRRGQEVFAQHLFNAGELRPDLGVPEAADIISTLMDHDIYRALVRDRGWTPAAWEAWFADLLSRDLLRS
jgi:TetR/AcrR family transcriptional regulator, regulator of autoinduction and epiphytic fitness